MKLDQLISELQEVQKKNSTPDIPMSVVLWTDDGEFEVTDVCCENETAYVRIEEDN